MRKIIWGITAVFCVQVAFQIGMSLSRNSADYAALRTPLQCGIETPSLVLAEDDLDPDIVFSEGPTEQSKPLVETRVIVKYVDIPVYRRTPARSAINAIFKPIVITYDRTGALTDAPEPPAQPPVPRVEHQDNNRSLAARVAAKPYDWLR